MFSCFAHKPKFDFVGKFAKIAKARREDEEDIMEKNVVAGVAYSRDEAKMTLISVADRPGIAAAIFGPLSEAGVNVECLMEDEDFSSNMVRLTSCVGSYRASSWGSVKSIGDGGHVPGACGRFDKGSGTRFCPRL